MKFVRSFKEYRDNWSDYLVSAKEGVCEWCEEGRVYNYIVLPLILLTFLVISVAPLAGLYPDE